MIKLSIYSVKNKIITMKILKLCSLLLNIGVSDFLSAILEKLSMQAIYEKLSIQIIEGMVGGENSF